MKKVLSAALVSLLSLSSVIAVTHSKKTFLSPRAVGANKAMEHTSWNSHIYHKQRCGKGKVRSRVQATAFYQRTVNDEELGKYFGVGNGKNTFRVAPESTKSDIDGLYLIHKTTAVATAAENTLAGNIELKPDQKISGVRLDYFQDLNTPIKNLFVKASLPFVRVENDVQIRISDDKNVKVDAQDFSLKDFFAGRVNNEKTGSNDLQGPLTHAKIDGRRSTMGLADLSLALGYKWHQSKTKYGFVNLGVVIPTGTNVRGEYLWEPVYGNGRHFGLSLGFDGGIRLWKGDAGKVNVDLGAQYKYLFEGTEQRTLGVKGVKLAHYKLAAKVGQQGKSFFPFANVLTRDLRVKPGSQIDALANFSFKNKHFVVDFGYNLFWKDAESAWVKNWDNDTFGIVKRNVLTSESTTISKDYLEDGFVDRDNLDVEAVKTPAQLTQKLFGGVGYTFNLSDCYPTSVGLGASYEFTQSNSATEQYAFWAKTAISF